MIERLFHLKPAIDAMAADNQVGTFRAERLDSIKGCNASLNEESVVSKTMSLQLLSDFEKRRGTIQDPLFDETVRHAATTRANCQIGPALLIAHYHK
jgi:hypothetical protein